jgi:hemoglobin-like flavoprotein
MSLTQQQIALVQSTFSQIGPMAETVAAMFYARLFEIDPSLRSMFKSDMRSQGQKLIQTLAVVVYALDRLEQIVPAVQALGRRHVDYGVKPEHYATVAEALLWTLEQGLGDDFTPEAKEAWTIAYSLLANTAIEATAVSVK